MKIKSLECSKSVSNYEKKILGTSDAWLMIRLSHRPSKPADYIVYLRIFDVTAATLGYGLLCPGWAKLDSTLSLGPAHTTMLFTT